MEDASAWSKSIPLGFGSLTRPSNRLLMRMKKKVFDSDSSRKTDSNLQLSSKHGAININFTVPPGTNTPQLDRRSSSLLNPATPTSGRPRMPSTSPAMSDADPTAARNGFFNALYAKYPSEKEKFADAKGKLDEEEYDLKTIHKVFKDDSKWESIFVKKGVGHQIRNRIKRFQNGELA
jgi:hypothetical protein